MMIDDLEVEAGPLARWHVHWCDPRREALWYTADPVLAGLPTLAEWAHAHGTQTGQPVLLRADGWSSGGQRILRLGADAQREHGHAEEVRLRGSRLAGIP
ncbi:hypothetical protein ABZX74_34975 [Streptomyces olivaceoviridis]|uniref:hypothetical protein n=1 Tax=Streptomyces olivaceoviridis TaxID=1921 RepID=UPI0033AF4145